MFLALEIIKFSIWWEANNTQLLLRAQFYNRNWVIDCDIILWSIQITFTVCISHVTNMQHNFKLFFFQLKILKSLNWDLQHHISRRGLITFHTHFSISLLNTLPFYHPFLPIVFPFISLHSIVAKHKKNHGWTNRQSML